MRVFLAGGSGLIGTRLVQALLLRGDQPVVLSRSADRLQKRESFKEVQVVQGDPTVRGTWEAALQGCEGVVNLAGHGILAERWNRAVKRKIRDSRVYSAETLTSALSRSGTRPLVFVQASAIAFYGAHGDENLTESSPPGADFLSVVCKEWEEAARPIQNLGTRLATVRVGIVLDRKEGALSTMMPMFRYGPGVPVGGGHPLSLARGRQWMSWIHIEDIVGLFLLALDHPEASGPINGTAPEPVRNADFARELSRALRGPLTPWRRYIPIGPPDALLELLYGEAAQVITRGQRVLPTRAQALGYAFRFPQLQDALSDLLGGPATGRNTPSSQVADSAAGSS